MAAMLVYVFAIFVFVLLSLIFYGIMTTPYNIFKIDGDMKIYRVERRALNTDKAREWFGKDIVTIQKWDFVVNSNLPLRKLLEMYKDNELFEFRIRVM